MVITFTGSLFQLMCVPGILYAYILGAAIFDWQVRKGLPNIFYDEYFSLKIQHRIICIAA